MITTNLPINHVPTKLLLSIIAGTLLVLTLYCMPMTLLCHSEYKGLISELRALNTCPHIEKLHREITDLKLKLASRDSELLLEMRKNNPKINDLLKQIKILKANIQNHDMGDMNSKLDSLLDTIEKINMIQREEVDFINSKENGGKLDKILNLLNSTVVNLTLVLPKIIEIEEKSKLKEWKSSKLEISKLKIDNLNSSQIGNEKLKTIKPEVKNSEPEVKILPKSKVKVSNSSKTEIILKTDKPEVAETSELKTNSSKPEDVKSSKPKVTNSSEPEATKPAEITETLEPTKSPEQESIDDLKDTMIIEIENVKNGIRRLESVKVMMLNSYTCPHIEIPEMTEFLSKRNPEKEAIFFTETSGMGFIKPRFVCAVESAAKAYSSGDIYLLFAYLPKYGLNTLINEALYSVLKHYTNVHVLKVDMDKLFNSTPLEDFHRRGDLFKSKHVASHTSDVLRSLVIYLYGGKYFDLDIITFKNISHPNFVQADVGENNLFAAGSFGFEKNSRVGELMLDKINSSFDPKNWGWNGPGVLTAAMINVTGADGTDDMNDSNMGGIVKMPYSSLFPINFDELLLYFDAKKSDETMKRLNEAKDLYGVHIGNNLIQNAVVALGSKQPFSLIAQEYCPRSYWSSYFDF